LFHTSGEICQKLLWISSLKPRFIWFVPALFTRMCNPPNLESVFLAVFSESMGFETSETTVKIESLPVKLRTKSHSLSEILCQCLTW
jgi:hypothetical protein